MIAAFDAVVVGGGPAGAAAAIALTRMGAEVALLERSQYERQRIGETLAQTAGVWLRQIGVDVAALSCIAAPGILSLWESTEPEVTDFFCGAFDEAMHVDRSALDAALGKAARRAGVEVQLGTRVRHLRRIDEHWLIDVGDREYRSRWIINATGRRGLGLAPSCRLDSLTAVFTRIDEVRHPDRRLAVEASIDGWWYFAPLPGNRGVIVYLTDADLLPVLPSERERFWLKSLGGTTLVASRVDNAVLGPLKIVSACSQSATDVVGDGWLTVGDAAIAHDPLSGAGVIAAVESGWRGGMAVGAALGGERLELENYRERWETETRQFLAERQRQYSRVRRWPTSQFWERRRKMAETGDSRGPRRGVVGQAPTRRAFSN